MKAFFKYLVSKLSNIFFQNHNQTNNKPQQIQSTFNKNKDNNKQNPQSKYLQKQNQLKKYSFLSGSTSYGYKPNLQKKYKRKQKQQSIKKNLEKMIENQKKQKVDITQQKDDNSSQQLNKKNNRESVDSSKFPYISIGYIQVVKQIQNQFKIFYYYGIGFLIFSYLLLTSAHIIQPFQQQTKSQVIKIIFHPSNSKKQQPTQYYAQSYFIPKQYLENKKIKNRKISNNYDFSLIVLKNKLHQKQGFLGIKIYQWNKQQQISIEVPGFVGLNKIQQPILKTSFGQIKNYDDQSQNVLYHNCCTNYGGSGAPILMKDKSNDVFVIGIHTGSNQIQNLKRGVKLNKIVCDRIKKWQIQIQTIIQNSKKQIQQSQSYITSQRVIIGSKNKPNWLQEKEKNLLEIVELTHELAYNYYHKKGAFQRSYKSYEKVYLNKQQMKIYLQKLQQKFQKYKNNKQLQLKLSKIRERINRIIEQLQNCETIIQQFQFYGHIFGWIITPLFNQFKHSCQSIYHFVQTKTYIEWSIKQYNQYNQKSYQRRIKISKNFDEEYQNGFFTN